MGKRSLMVGVMVCVLAGCAHVGVKNPSSELRAGAASVAVNPDVCVFLAGYDLQRRCTGVHDDLWAKAVVFDDGVTPLALVSVDSIGLQYDTVQEARALASAAVKGIAIPPERIIVCSTHTHCSPDVIGIYGPDEEHTGRDPEYMKALTRGIAEAVAKAAERLEPVTLVSAQTEGPSWAVNDSEPGEILNTVTVLQCLNAKGAPIATLTQFPCHPTVLDGEVTLASADWVGAFYKAMAAHGPGEQVFLQGGVGGWIQPVTPDRTFKRAEEYGRDLAARVTKALRGAAPVTPTPIRFAHKVFGIPNTNDAFKEMSTSGLIPRPLGDTVDTEVAWFAIGDAQFATHPGESAPQFSRETMALMKTGPRFILGLGLDQLGYIVKPEYFDAPDKFKFADYLTSMSLGRETGPALIAALAQIIP